MTDQTPDGDKEQPDPGLVSEPWIGWHTVSGDATDYLSDAEQRQYHQAAARREQARYRQQQRPF